MKFFTLIILFLVSQLAMAQKSPLKFGDIPMEDLTMMDYEGDSSVSAVMLLQYGEAQLGISKFQKESNGYIRSWYQPNMVYKKHIRIKILNSAGAARWGNIQEGWSGSAHNSGEFLDIQGATYNLENGKVVKTELTQDGKFDDKVVKGFSIKKIAMPNVKPGSVIEYTYTLRSSYGGGLPEWKFQWKIPVRESEYWTIVPDYFDYITYMQGFLPADIFETNYEVRNGTTNKIQHLVMHNVPAFKEEPFMPSPDDYVSKMNFVMRSILLPEQARRNLVSSWEDINDRLMKDDEFAGVVKGKRFLKDVTESLVKGIDDPMKKIEAIHTYVRNNIEWNDRISRSPGELEKVFKEQKGSSADINFILAAMLDKAGFMVEMILLSTREHGMIRKSYPDLAQFNDVICAVRVDGKPVLLDATERHLPMELLPERCMNGEGFIISSIASGWIEITGKKSIESVAAELSLGTGTSFSGKVVITLDGHNALSVRSANRSNGEDSWLKHLSKVNDFKISKSEIANIDDVHQPVKATLEVEFAEETESLPNIIYLNPYIAKPQTSNPFKSEGRMYPVDFGHPFDQKYFAKIIIPEGYYVDELPASTILRLENSMAKFTFNTNTTPQFITVTSALQISKSIFNTDEYPHLREFYSQMVAKQAEMIVLKRKK